MGLFIKRPLALASLAMMAFCALGMLLAPKPMQFAIVALATVALLLLVWFFRARRKFSYTRFLLLLIAVFSLVGGVRGFFEARAIKRLTEHRIGQTVKVEMSILETRYTGSYASEFLAELHFVDGEDIGGKAVLKCSYALPFYEGDRLRGNFRMESRDFDDPNQTNRANGVRAVLVSESDDSLFYISRKSSPFDSFKTLQSRLSHSLRTVIGGEEGNLIAALLLGTTQHLDGATVRDFRRIGVSHLLSLSGLHIAILIGFADRVLRACRVRKAPRLVLAMALALFYFLLTGCLYSVLRTLIMLSFVSLSFFLREDSDGITALLFGAALTVLFVPYAIFDLSWQMTTLATFGILAFAPLGERILQGRVTRNIGIGLLRKCLISLLITYSASMAILPIQWLVFGETSVLAPLSNLLLVPLCTPVLILGFLCLPVAFIPSLCRIVGALPAIFAKLLLFLSSNLSKIRGVISFEYDFVPYVLIPFFAVTAVLLCIELGRRNWLTLLPAVPAIAAFAICLAITNQGAGDGINVCYSAENGRDRLLFSRGTRGVICDVANSSGSQLLSDWYILREEGVTELEALILTDYDEQTPNAVARFAQSVLVRTLYVPKATNIEQARALRVISEIGARTGLFVTVFSHEEAISVLEVGRLTLSMPLHESRSTLPAFRVKVEVGERQLWYESSAYGEYRRHIVPTEASAGLDYCILGSNGPVPHETIFLEHMRPEATVIVGLESAQWLLRRRADCQYVILPRRFSFRLS